MALLLEDFCHSNDTRNRISDEYIADSGTFRILNDRSCSRSVGLSMCPKCAGLDSTSHFSAQNFTAEADLKGEFEAHSLLMKP